MYACRICIQELLVSNHKILLHFVKFSESIQNQLRKTHRLETEVYSRSYKLVHDRCLLKDRCLLGQMCPPACVEKLMSVLSKLVVTNESRGELLAGQQVKFSKIIDKINPVNKLLFSHSVFDS